MHSAQNTHRHTQIKESWYYHQTLEKYFSYRIRQELEYQAILYIQPPTPKKEEKIEEKKQREKIVLGWQRILWFFLFEIFVSSRLSIELERVQ